jgi:hypothetical protein
VADVRVVVQDEPGFFRFLGIYPEEACIPEVLQQDRHGVSHNYRRVASTPRWVLYRAPQWNGSAAPALDPMQR